MSEDDETQYLVVVNQDEQYSIWPADREGLAPGWTATGFSGTRAACLAHLQQLWVDMRPPGLR